MPPSSSRSWPDLPDRVLAVPLDTTSSSTAHVLLTLERAQRLALDRNPDLAAFGWDIRVRQGRSLQAGLRPNPELFAEMEDFGGTGTRRGTVGADATMGASQRFETGGKRGKRRRTAELDTEVARWEYETVRLRVLADVVEAFAATLAAQRRVELTEQLTQVAERTGRAVARLVRAGATPRVDRIRAGVEAGLTRVQETVARRELNAARAQLAAIWGAEDADFDRAIGPLDDLPSPLEFAVLRSQLAGHPVLRKWERENARRTAVVELEDSQRVPDLTVRAGARWLGEVNETAFVGAVSAPVPLFDRNQGARAAARTDLLRAAYEQRSAEVQLTAHLTTEYQELLARFEELRELRTAILPGAQQAFDGVRRGYQQGLFRNVDVLDAQRRLFELRLREVEALQLYHRALGRVEQLTGNPPRGGLAPPASPP